MGGYGVHVKWYFSINMYSVQMRFCGRKKKKEVSSCKDSVGGVLVESGRRHKM